MKKQLCAFITALAIMASPAAAAITATPVYAKSATLKVDNNYTGMNSQEKKIYKKLISLKSKLPEGKHWSNQNYYKWKGGIFRGGYGCAAFAFKLSDAAFGKAKAWRHKAFSKVRIGDIVRMDHDTHTVIVLKVVGKKCLVAEGNMGGKVHWGRVIPISAMKKTGTYVMTRYKKS